MMQGSAVVRCTPKLGCLLLLGLVLAFSSGAKEVPNRGAEAGLAVRVLITEVTPSTATAYVLVENEGAAAVTIPIDLSQWISETYRIGTHGMGAAFHQVYCPGDRGIVELLPGHCLGRQVQVGKVVGATAVRFQVDLGEELGVVQSDWTEVSGW